MVFEKVERQLKSNSGNMTHISNTKFGLKVCVAAFVPVKSEFLSMK